MGEGEYVLGLEPCNCFVGGRLDAGNNGTLEYIEPGETKNFDLTIELLNGMEDINYLIKTIDNFK